MKIDFVLIWVDGSDRDWLTEKQKYEGKRSESSAGKETDIDDELNRYRDWDNLKYWFRSIEKNAPWVNKIYFVTCGQTPSWLNTGNDKLVLINHKDYTAWEFEIHRNEPDDITKKTKALCLCDERNILNIIHAVQRACSRSGDR